MGKLSGLKDGEAITADVNDDRADAGDVTGPDEDVLLAGAADDVRPPPDCKMLKPGNAGGMEEEDDVEIGKSVAAVAAAAEVAAPRVAVRSSGEIDGWWWWWPAELLLNALKAGLVGVGSGGGSGNGTDVVGAVVTATGDGRLMTGVDGLLAVVLLLPDTLSPGVEARVGENSK